MTPELVSIIALILLFVVGTVLPINMGALGFVAAWLVGHVLPRPDEKEIISGISGDLVLTLVGVTYLFAIARNNGTVDLIVRGAVRTVGGRVALIPWVMFAVTAVLTAIGAASPAACAIIGPIALGFAGRYQHQPADDGHVRRARRAGRRVLADQHLRRHHQLRHGRERPAGQRDGHLPEQPPGQPGHRRCAVLRARWTPAGVAAGRTDELDDDLVGGGTRRGHGDGGATAMTNGGGGTATEARAATTVTPRLADQVVTLVAFGAVAFVALVFEQEHRLRGDHRRGRS